jgi:molecular chaperone GrpE
MGDEHRFDDEERTRRDDRHDDGDRRGGADARGGGPDRADDRDRASDRGGASDRGAPPDEAPASAPDEQQEADILRSELRAVSERLSAIEADYQACLDKMLRARADLENVRRRQLAELDRARESGIDAAVMPVLDVYDDLGRALRAAEASDASNIVPGVRGVRDSLERSLASIGIERVGAVGDAFDPSLHEAMAVVPAGEGGTPGAIAEVFETGFRRGERLVRPARVVVVEQP